MALVGAYAGSFSRDTTDLEDYWKRTAAVRLGVRVDQLYGFYHPIGAVGEYDSADFITATSGTRTHTGGYYRLDTADATDTARYYPGSNGTDHPVQIAAGATVKFWMGMRAKFPIGVVGANCIAGMVLRAAGGTNEFTFGKRGAQSATNIVVYGAAGTPFDTGIAFDASVHNFEIFRADGTNTVPVIDGVYGTAGNARPSAAAGVDLTVTDSAGAQQQLDIAWYAIYTTIP